MNEELDALLGPVDTSVPETPDWKPTPRYAEIMFDLAKGVPIKEHAVFVTDAELMQLAVDAGLKKK
jgi:hypothetical protein